MRFFAGALLVVSLGVLTGCAVSTDPFETLSVSGTVTAGGAPASVRIELSAGNFRAVRDFQGTYTLSLSGGGVPASNCGDVRLSASLLDDDGTTVLDVQTRDIGECGEHDVDFAFP